MIRKGECSQMGDWKMDMWKYYDITHRYHRLCNPLNDAKFDELCDLLGLEAGARVLDIACGKGEVLVRLAERFGIAGTGVDLSPYAIRDARERHARRAPGAALEFICLDGAAYRPDRPGSFDLAACIGASWIWQGYRGTLRALREMTKPGGLLMAGEPFWIKEPPREYLEMEGMRRDDYATHHENILAGEAEGLVFLYALVSSDDDWDRYEGLQWYAAAGHARAVPADPDLPEITGRVVRSRDSYLRWGRDCLGWAVYLFRKP
jgi:SAM-dependent methyltransferase